MNDREKAVLAANKAFYEAFLSADYQTMESLWAHDHEIAIIHPGWQPLHGRKAVMDTWRRILTGNPQANMNCSEARVYLMGEVACVICIERLAEGEVVATNLFVQENGIWKLVHHHGGLIAQVLQDSSRDMVH